MTTVSMAALAGLALMFYLAPAYAQPDTYPTSEVVPNPVDIQFDSFAKLRGYRVDAGPVEP